MSDAMLAFLGAIVTGILSLIGVYVANRKSATLIEYQIKELTKQVEKHNGWGDRITKMETQIQAITKDVDAIKKKVSA